MTTPAATVSTPRCAASFDPGQTMLGDRQERWLESRLRRNRARWTVLANQVMVTELDHDPGPGTVHWQDSWDGYPAARQRMLEALTTQRNPIIITGDWHSTFVNDIKFDYQTRWFADRRHRGHHAGDHLERRWSRLRAVLRPDDRLEPAHQVLRGRPQGVRPVPRRQRDSWRSTCASSTSSDHLEPASPPPPASSSRMGNRAPSPRDRAGQRGATSFTRRGASGGARLRSAA